MGRGEGVSVGTSAQPVAGVKVARAAPDNKGAAHAWLIASSMDWRKFTKGTKGRHHGRPHKPSSRVNTVELLAGQVEPLTWWVPSQLLIAKQDQWGHRNLTSPGCQTEPRWTVLFTPESATTGRQALRFPYIGRTPSASGYNFGQGSRR